MTQPSAPIDASPVLIPRDDVVRRLCQLSANVGAHFNFNFAADCFCDSADPTDPGRQLFAAVGMGDYRFDERVMVFIENAVNEKMEREP